MSDALPSILPPVLLEVMGPTLVVGAPTGDLAQALAATASEIRAWPMTTFPEVAPGRPPVTSASPEEVGDRLATSLVVCGVPEGADPMTALDRLFSELAHDGFFVIDLPAETVRKHRLDGFLASCARDVVDLAPEGDRLVRVGRREAPGREAAFEAAPPAPLTALIVARRPSDELGALCADLLFRQNVPPAALFVIDDGREDDPSIPEDLWGMAEHAPISVMTAATGGVGRGPALGAALDHIETELLLIVGDRRRLTPGAVAALANVLEDRDVLAAFSDVVVRDEPARRRRAGPPPRPVRRTDLSELQGAACALRVSAVDRERSFARGTEVQWNAAGLVRAVPLPLTIVPAKRAR